MRYKYLIDLITLDKLFISDLVLYLKNKPENLLCNDIKNTFDSLYFYS